MEKMVGWKIPYEHKLLDVTHLRHVEGAGGL